MAKAKMTLADVFEPILRRQYPQCRPHQFERHTDRIGAPCNVCGHPVLADCHRKIVEAPRG